MPITDSFSGASLGSGWSVISLIGSPTWVESSGYIKAGTAYGYSVVRRTETSFPDDQYAQIDTEVATGAGGDGSDYVGPAVRMDSSGNCYFLSIGLVGFTLYRRGSSTNNYITEASFSSIGNDTFHTFKISVTGTVITGYLDGVLKLTFDTTSDVTKLSSGNPGFSCYVGSLDKAPRLDNFECTDVLADILMAQSCF